MSSSVAPEVQLVLEWGKGFQTGDLDLLARCLHEDYRHVTYPRSLGQGERTKDDFVKYLSGFVPAWTESVVSYFSPRRATFAAAKSLPQSTTHSIIEVPGKVIVHVRIPNLQINTTPT